MSTHAEKIEAAMIGARAALDTFDELLGEFVEARRDVDPDEPALSLNDVRRLIQGARHSIEDLGRPSTAPDDHSASRHLEVLKREAPHLIADEGAA